MRLFPVHQRVERDWYQRTGIFSMMHTFVVRCEPVEEHPEIANTLYDAYRRSKEIAMDIYRRARVDQHIGPSAPWFSELFCGHRAPLPRRLAALGVAANRKTVDTFRRHHFEQELSPRPLTCRDIFLPSLLDA